MTDIKVRTTLHVLDGIEVFKHLLRYGLMRIGALNYIREYIRSHTIRRIRAQYPSIGRNVARVSHAAEGQDLGELAVYTTYCGTFKNKTMHLNRICSIIPHYFVSNNLDVPCLALDLGYIPVHLDVEVSDDPILSAYQAKIVKVLPHTIKPLNSFKFLFYKDDKILIDPSRIKEFMNILVENDGSLAIRPHNLFSGNLLYEFGAAMGHDRYRDEWDQSINYITEELRNGASLECQMYMTGVILRNMSHPDTISINDLWWQHVCRCGIECQISFDIVAQRYRSIVMLPMNLE
jgi:hypothetical protein